MDTVTEGDPLALRPSWVQEGARAGGLPGRSLGATLSPAQSAPIHLSARSPKVQAGFSPTPYPDNAQPPVFGELLCTSVNVCPLPCWSLITRFSPPAGGEQWEQGIDALLTCCRAWKVSQTAQGLTDHSAEGPLQEPSHRAASAGVGT